MKIVGYSACRITSMRLAATNTMITRKDVKLIRARMGLG